MSMTRKDRKDRQFLNMTANALALLNIELFIGFCLEMNVLQEIRNNRDNGVLG